MIDVLVISHSCFRIVNRAVYRKMADSLTLEILAPKCLYTGGKKIEHDPRIEEDPVIYFRELTKSNPRLYSYDGLKVVLESTRPKLVILDNDPLSVLGVQLGKWCKKNGSVLQAITCENLSFSMSASYSRNGLKGIAPGLFKNVALLLVRNRVKTLYVINNQGKSIYEKAGFKKVVKIPLGFDPGVFHPSKESRKVIRDKHNIANSTVVSYFGRLVKEKGVHLLLDALSQLKDLNWNLFIDKFESHLSDYHQTIASKIEEYGFADRVVYVIANHTEIADYMNASDIVVLPSISTKKWVEQYGRVVPEAMACSNLLIVSNSGTPKELIDNNGLTFEEGNVANLVAVLRDSISNLKRFDDMRNNAGEHARKALSITSQIDIMLNQIEQDLK